jgi:hypothetical protein
MERIYSHPVEDMGESDRNPSLASIWRDQVRVQVEHNHVEATAETIRKLEQLAAQSRDLIVENCYESARGYVFFAQKDYASAARRVVRRPSFADSN